MEAFLGLKEAEDSKWLHCVLLLCPCRLHVAHLSAGVLTKFLQWLVCISRTAYPLCVESVTFSSQIPPKGQDFFFQKEMVMAAQTALCSVPGWCCSREKGRVSIQSPGGSVFETATVTPLLPLADSECALGQEGGVATQKWSGGRHLHPSASHARFPFSQLPFQDLKSNLSIGSCFICFSVVSCPGVVIC